MQSPIQSPLGPPRKRSPGLEAVFLDLGSTLLHEQPGRAEIYARAARDRGVAVEAARMEALMAAAHAALPREVAGGFRYSDAWFRTFQRRLFLDELGLDPGGFEELSAELFERFEDAATFRLYPGARELLAALRAGGLFVGLISNWSARLPRLLRALGLEGAFDGVLCSALEGLEKPDPRLFRRALERAGVEAGAALHAGDHPERDVAGALAAGLRAVWVRHGPGLETAPAPPCPVVTSLAALQDLILGAPA